MRLEYELELRLDAAKVFRPCATAILIGIAIVLMVTPGCGENEKTPPKSFAQEDSERVSPQHTSPKTDAVQADLSPVDAAADDSQTLDRLGKIEWVEEQLRDGNLDAAATALRSLLLVDPNDVEVIFRLATLRATKGDLPQAIELLDGIPDDHLEAGLPALGQSADWCMQIGRYEEAERRYQRILELLPTASEANRKLAYLFNCQGRRHEAAAQIEQLCLRGDVRSDELHSLIHLSDAMYDDASIPQSSASDVRYLPIGAAAIARKLFMEEKYDEALSTLEELVRSGDAPPSIVAFYGRIAAEAQDDRSFLEWLQATTVETRKFAEYWAAIGTFQMLQGKTEQAIRALLEAVDRDPTDLKSAGRLRSLFESLGKQEEATRWEERYVIIRRTLRENNKIADSQDADAMIALGNLLDSIGRRLEGALWRMLASHYKQSSPDLARQLNQQINHLISSGKGGPSRADRLCGTQLEAFSLPRIEYSDDQILESQLRTTELDLLTPPRFINVAEQVGLEHAFQVASIPHEYGFAVYQSIGGAVVALDYDLDGQVELYCSQGGSDAPTFRGAQTNSLFRSIDGQLIDVTLAASAEDYQYSIGATAGDWNQDGFVDIVIGNLGANTLLINNGDGTFSSSTLDDRDDRTMMTTSLALADVTGDAIPDLFELNYLHDSRIAQRPEVDASGDVVQSMNPMDFLAGVDRIVVRDAAGEPTFQNVGGPDIHGRAGLGIVVGDFDRKPGNEVFVANDLYPNQLWSFDRARGVWNDQAMLRGCAHGFNGGNTASMGVAAGDLTGNGMLDLHITNFQNEKVSLYLNNDGFFQDRNVQFGLGLPSVAVLGFGTQCLDYDNDSRLDLVVANGHIEKAADLNASFRQPAQLFGNLGDRFELIDVEDDSGYWDEPHVGRGLSTLDFNRDGRMDFAVTHLGERTALLLNQTPTMNHWLQIRLVGTKSERDAIGARIEAKSKGQSWTAWINAGDGFLCRNEPIVALGLGDQTLVDELTISWPSGEQQRFSNIPVDQRLLVIEDSSDLFTLSSVSTPRETKESR